MIQIQAFHGCSASGQQACDKAAAKANSWLRKHRDIEVISTSTSQNGFTFDGEPGVEYTLTLTLNVPAYYVEIFEQEEEALEMPQ